MGGTSLPFNIHTISIHVNGFFTLVLETVTENPFTVPFTGLKCFFAAQD